MSPNVRAWLSDFLAGLCLAAILLAMCAAGAFL